MDKGQLSLKRNSSRFTQKILFLVPTKNLVEQQTKYFEDKLSKLLQFKNTFRKIEWRNLYC